MDKEGWFHRLVRHLLVRAEGSRALDVVSQTITTPFDTPDDCLVDEWGTSHIWYPQGDTHVHANGTEEAHARCNKCGAVMQTIWRPQPGTLGVILGRRG